MYDILLVLNAVFNETTHFPDLLSAVGRVADLDQGIVINIWIRIPERIKMKVHRILVSEGN